MGVSIDIHVYDRQALEADIDNFVKEHGGYRDNALNAHDFLERVGNEYGRLTDTEFLVMWNEYYEDYNPASCFLVDVERYYFPHTDKDDYDFWSSSYSTIDGGVEGVLESVFEDEFGYEGEFSDE